MKDLLSRIFICATVIFALSSCEHKELCEHHPHTASIRLEFDWTDAPEANPEGMCVFFYPTDGNNALRRFDFQGKTGGLINIPVGKYQVLCYNNDTESVLFDGTNHFETHRAFTRDCDLFENIYGSASAKTPRAKDAEEERTVISPDMMWGSTATDVEITDNGISYISNPESQKDKLGLRTTITGNDLVLPLYPHELICTYTYEIRHVDGLDRVAQMCGSLSGMAPSLLMSTEELGKECVTIPFEAHKADESTITGRFLTFGHHPDNQQPHKMSLYVWMDDGSRYYYGNDEGKFNVTSQVHSAPDKRHVHIIIDGLGLPKPIAGDSGFVPSADDWLEIDHDIHL